MKENKYKEIKNKYIGIGMTTGLMIGIVMGKFFDDTSMGIAAGLGLGVIIAVAKFEYDKKHNKLKK